LFADVDVRCKAAEAIKEGQEAFQSAAYPQILEACVPALLNQVLGTQPQTEETDVQKLRQVSLEALGRLYYNEALRPYVYRLLEALLMVVTTDNQRNAMVAAKAFSDVLRAYVRSLENIDHICVAYMEFVLKVGP
jgi:hypothetical protein